MKKTITVIVPVFNTADYLPRCLDSIVNQNDCNLNIIIIDDCSSDGSGLICDEYAFKYDNVKCIHLKQNMGVSYVRNLGIELAESDYISFIDSDDYISADYFNAMSNAKECDIVFGKIIHDYDGVLIPFNEINLESIKHNVSPYYFLIDGHAHTEKESIITLSIFGSVWRSVFKKEILNKYQIRFSENTFFGEDLLFMLNYIDRIKSVEIVDAYYYYVLHKSSVTGSKYSGYANNYVEKYKPFFESIITFITNSLTITKNRAALIDYQKMSFCVGFVINELFLSNDATTWKLKDFFVGNNKKYLHFSIFNILKVGDIKLRRIIFLLMIKFRMWKLLKLHASARKT